MVHYDKLNLSVESQLQVASTFTAKIITPKLRSLIVYGPELYSLYIIILLWHYSLWSSALFCLINGMNMIPFSRKFSRDPIFTGRPAAKISQSSFCGWIFQYQNVTFSYRYLLCGFNICGLPVKNPANWIHREFPHTLAHSTIYSQLLGKN